MSDDAQQRPAAELDSLQFDRIIRPVRRMLERHGVPKKEHAGALVETLQIASSPVYRKLDGRVSFTPPELITIAEFYGESPAELLLNCLNSEAQSIAVPCNGQFISGTGWFGARTSSPHTGQVVALPREALSAELLAHLHIPASSRIPDGCEWVAVPYSSEMRSRPKAIFEVQRLLLEPPPPRKEPIRVAVLDDDKPSADSHVSLLRADGVHAEAFYTVASLEAVFKLYNTFLLDFVIGKKNTSLLIEHISSALPHARMAVLTGHMVDDSEHGDELKRHMANRIQVLTKPASYGFIAAALLIPTSKPT